MKVKVNKKEELMNKCCEYAKADLGAKHYLFRFENQKASAYGYVALFVKEKQLVLFNEKSVFSISETDDFKGFSPRYKSDNIKLSRFFIENPDLFDCLLYGSLTKQYDYSRFCRNGNPVINNVVFIKFVFEQIFRENNIIELIYFD